MRDDRKSQVRERGQRSRRFSHDHMKMSIEDTMRKRAATVEETHQRQAAGQNLRSKAVALMFGQPLRPRVALSYFSSPSSCYHMQRLRA